MKKSVPLIFPPYLPVSLLSTKTFILYLSPRLTALPGPLLPQSCSHSSAITVLPQPFLGIESATLLER